MTLDYTPDLPYRVGVGHDVAYLDTDIITQQPQVSPVAPVERHYGVGGAHYDEGLYVRFHFDVLESPELYRTVLTLFGLHDNETSPVTIYAKSSLLYWRKYNGTARRPEPGTDAKWGRFFWQDIDIYVTDLVEISE